MTPHSPKPSAFNEKKTAGAALSLRSTVLRFGLTLLLGVIGGGAFFMLNLPLPWMLGAMTAATIAALSGAPLVTSRPIRNGMVAVLGVLLGSQFSPGIFDEVGQWYVGMIGVVGSVILMVTLTVWFFRKVGGYDRTTAYFSAMPGGLSEMMTLGEAFGGDAQRISLSHGIRILTAVFLIAFYYRIFEGYAPVALPVESIATQAWQDMAILAGCAIVGYPIATLLRVPAGQLVGPLTLSGILHMTGLVEAQPPAEFVAAAQVVLGATIGARFAGWAFSEVWRTLLLGIGAAVIMVLIAAGTAYGLGALSDTPGANLFLALAPGGLAEMSIIALSFGSAAAFVSTHHIVRIILIVILAPLLFKLVLAPRWREQDD